MLMSDLHVLPPVPHPPRRQLMSLFERGEMLKKENEVLNQRLDAEMDTQRALHQDLHEARSQEARMMRRVVPHSG